MSNEKLKRKDFLKSIAGIRKKSVEVMPGDAPGDPMSCLKNIPGKPWGQAIQRKD